jgi:hypothetical protein
LIAKDDTAGVLKVVCHNNRQKKKERAGKIKINFYTLVYTGFLQEFLLCGKL